jgi:hypothetical protein
MSELDFQAINKLTELLRERKDALTIRWLYATATIGAFALIVALFEQGRPRVPMALTVVVWLATAVLAGLSIWLPRKKLTDRDLLRQLRLPVDVHGWAQKMRLNAEQTRTLAELPSLEQRLFGLTLIFERPYMLGLALAGGLAVLGLVYGLIAGTLVEATVPLVGALALNCWHYPRLTSLIDRGRKLESKDEDEAMVRELTRKGGQRRPPASDSERPPAPASTPPPATAGRARPTAGRAPAPTPQGRPRAPRKP